jgi:hypothetical protein
MHFDHVEIVSTERSLNPVIKDVEKPITRLEQFHAKRMVIRDETIEDSSKLESIIMDLSSNINLDTIFRPLSNYTREFSSSQVVQLS